MLVTGASGALLAVFSLASCRDTIKSAEITEFCRFADGANESAPLYVRHAIDDRAEVVVNALGDFNGTGSCAVGSCTVGEESWSADGCGSPAFVRAHRAASRCLERTSPFASPVDESGEWCLTTRRTPEDAEPPPCRCRVEAAAVADLAIGLTSRRVPTLGLERCWETGPARDGGDGCEIRFTLYDDGSFICAGGAGRLERRAADRLRHAAAGAVAGRPLGDAPDPRHVLRRYDEGSSLLLAPADVQEIERVMGAFGSRCGF